jgi:hypothetical protein
VLLGLRVRPVGDRRDAVDQADRLGVRRVGQPLAADQLAGLGELLHYGIDLGHQVLALLAEEGLPRLGVVVDQQHVLHVVAPLMLRRPVWPPLVPESERAVVSRHGAASAREQLLDADYADRST